MHGYENVTMARAILIACSPWLAVLLVLFLAAWALVRFSRAQLRLGRLLNFIAMKSAACKA